MTNGYGAMIPIWIMASSINNSNDKPITNCIVQKGIKYCEVKQAQSLSSTELIVMGSIFITIMGIVIWASWGIGGSSYNSTFPEM